MNEHLLERFGRSRRAHGPVTGQAHVWLLPQQLNTKVREYFEDAKKPVEGGSWLERPEIPTSAEVLDTETAGSNSSDETVGLNVNRPKGAWESKGKIPRCNRPKGMWTSADEYLGTHYELLREDAVRGLRVAVSRVKFTPEAKEDAFGSAIGIYDKVHICGIIPSTRGLAHRVTFSYFRIGKKIVWEQSKRLITGSLVVLTPSNDMFKTKAIVATVAARPLSGLTQDPPEIDLFFARAEDVEVDPAVEWVMVEDRRGLYEAHRHTMLGLQMMMREPFPLKEHLLTLQKEISAPKYVESHPMADLTAVLHNTKQDTYENVDILKAWPRSAQSNLDPTQLEALERILTKRLAIVQGPPGTGKTFVSTEAIRVMLANRRPGDPPIILACQTNHAIDQLLNHVAAFEPDFVRLGGRSKDRGVVKARTLYEVRKQTSDAPPAGPWEANARKKRKELTEQIKMLMQPLNPGKMPLDPNTLKRLGLLTERQADSLEAGASQWVQSQLSNPNQPSFTIWLGKSLISVPTKQMPDDYGFDYEETEQETEQLKEQEAENAGQEEDEIDSLRGELIPIADNFTCRKPTGKTSNKDVDEAKTALKEEDMWKIREALRPAIYRFLQVELKKKIQDALCEKTKLFNEWAAKGRIGLWEKDETILKNQKIIGMTTTGLSKYRGLLASLQPRIVLIEEAAETMEAPVTVGCLPSLEQLILVGDHQQLRPHCHVQDLEDDEYWLNLSLFERLSNNGIPLTTLGLQRRMIPEIRRLIYPIYKNLIQDHPSVIDPANRPNVPGMGGVNSFFFTHSWPERRDEYMSVFNQDEVSMIIGLVEYLVFNGMKTTDITVLTFYNAQRKKLLSGLRKRPSLYNEDFIVRTVDSYQGDQNKVVILSLVRSNDHGQVGFLNVRNRICVALSRAQQGLYIFGNGLMLYNDKNSKNCKGQKTWKNVIDIMSDNAEGNSRMVRTKNRLKTEPISRIGTKFPIRCANHGNSTEINEGDEWNNLAGGCALPCEGKLPCGHACTLTCHPFPHEVVRCDAACGKALKCGHECREKCADPCSCKTCSKGRGKMKEVTNIYRPGDDDLEEKTVPHRSDSDSWNLFAEEELIRYASAAASATSSLRSSPEKNDTGSWVLVDVGLAKDMEELSVRPTTAQARPQPQIETEEKSVPDGERKKWNDFVSGNQAGGYSKDWSREGSLLD